MMKKLATKMMTGLFATATLVFGLTGCGAEFDAKAYVEGNLDAICKNEISDELAKMTEGGKEALQKEYDATFDELLSELESSGCPEELLDYYKTTMQNLFKKAKYSVGEATKGEDGSYTVPVTSEPIILDGGTAEEKIQAHLEEWMTEQVEKGTEVDETLMWNEYFTFYIDLIDEMVKNPEYGEAQTVEVRVVKNSDNLYSVSDEDMESIMNTILTVN